MSRFEGNVDALLFLYLISRTMTCLTSLHLTLTLLSINFDFIDAFDLIHALRCW